MKKVIPFCLLITAFFALSFTYSAYADSTIVIAVQPTSVTASYGANRKEVTLLFYLVNHSPAKQALSDFKFYTKDSKASAYVEVAKFENDCNSVLPPSGKAGVCNVNVILKLTGAQSIGQKIGPFTYALTFRNGTAKRGQTFYSSAFPINFADGSPITSANRTLTFVNQCTSAVWIGLASGATNSITPDPAQIPANLTSCLSNTDCYPGSTCIFVHAAGGGQPALSQCYWSNPTPNDQPTNFQLDPAGGLRTSTTTTIPAYYNGIDTIWTGGAVARTGCSGGQGANSCSTGNCCVNALCGNTAACPAGSGFLTPASKVEFTFLNQLPIVSSNTPNGNTDGDSYDVTMVDGISVPVSMAPTNGVWGGSSSPYTCGTPGSAIAQSPLGACDWTFAPTASSTSPPKLVTTIYAADYNWLSTTGFTTQIDCDSGGSVCGVGTTCGVAYVGGTTLTVGCGTTQLGYWSADSLCGKDATGATPVGSRFGCGQVVQAPLTLTDLYGCSTGNLKLSCYTSPSSTCCGCVNWNSVSGVSVPPSPITGSCPAGGVNTNWTTYSQNTVTWLKKGCPTAYSYPYDDKSSTFTCSTLNSSKQNVTNYTITFCPS